MISPRALVPAALVFFGLCANLQAAEVKHVIHISVDGLKRGAVDALGPALAPNYFRLRREGAYTANARTDPVFVNTLPNHASQITGRTVSGSGSHGLVINSDDGTTIHTLKGSYVESVFDVVHDHGLSTALFASKEKFALFDRSYDGLNGAADSVGTDNGQDKIDRYVFDTDIGSLTNQFVSYTSTQQPAYAMLHVKEPDTTGHQSNWDIRPGSAYLEAVKTTDALLGKVLNMIDSVAGLKNETALVLTSDHGGIQGLKYHFILLGNVESTWIPFYIWGVGVAVGADLYALNKQFASDPGDANPAFDASAQPIRNGDVANLVCRLLGLLPVSGSRINSVQQFAADDSPSTTIIAPVINLLIDE